MLTSIDLLKYPSLLWKPSICKVKKILWNKLASLKATLVQNYDRPNALQWVAQCTLHNGASNEIKEIKVCKKWPKVKPYCAPICDPIMFKTFLDDAKLPKFSAKCFSLSKQSNIGCIFLTCLWKVTKGWSDNYEIYTIYSSCHVQKKTRKQKNCPGSPSLWILNLKNTNIFQIFS